jgi:hypothetical protein
MVNSMDKIITIYEMFDIPNRGLVIGGVNPSLDTMSYKQIRKLIGTSIEIHQSNGSVLKTPIIDVEISTSLANKKNIFILLPEAMKKTTLQKGAVVYRKWNGNQAVSVQVG